MFNCVIITTVLVSTRNAGLHFSDCACLIIGTTLIFIIHWWLQADKAEALTTGADHVLAGFLMLNQEATFDAGSA